MKNGPWNAIHGPLSFSVWLELEVNLERYLNLTG
jgi:hypothetical protein